MAFHFKEGIESVLIMKRKFTLQYGAALMAFLLWAYPGAVKATEASPAASNMEETVNIIEISAQGEIVSDVFVRRGPSRDYEVMGTVREKEVVAISGKTADEWYRIIYEGQPGFVYGDYIRVAKEEPTQPPPQEDDKEPEEESGEEEEELPSEDEKEQEPEPGESTGGRVDWGYIKLAAIVVIVAVILAMIVLILRSLLQASLQETEEEKKKNKSPRKTEKSRTVKREDKKTEAAGDGAAGQSAETKEDQEGKAARAEEARTIIIREEDYQLHIDPKYFEDEPLAQPDYVTDYLKKKELEDTKTVAKKERSDDLTKAMKKLEELQEEIERLKNK